MEWIGSQACDGHHWAIFTDYYPHGRLIDHRKVKTEDDWRTAVHKHLTALGHGTIVEDGWPHRWDTSDISDYAYTFENGVIYEAGKYVWVPLKLALAIYKAAKQMEPGDSDDPAYEWKYAQYSAVTEALYAVGKGDTEIPWPDMSSRRQLPAPGSRRSGVIAMGIGPDGPFVVNPDG